ncbi:MAG: ROK family transcriptional regulator [Bryobacterales bacterium]|nr:ROK family transcriptional regulator [Bryobacterales bacterium]
MRRLNGALLLDLIRDKGPASRAELARLSGLTKPTVSSQVADLLRRALVVEDGTVEPDERGGKRSKLLRFNPQCGNLIGVEIGSSVVRVRLADLDGAILDGEDAEVWPERGADHILTTAVTAINLVLSRSRGRKQKLMIVAVAAPGRVDSDSGVVLEAGNVFHWRGVAVREHFQRAFKVPILVENDVNLAALGEMHYGLGQGVKNFVLIRLTTGVGAGLVVGGRLYQGNHWAAGEIGHMVFDQEAAAGVPNDRGYLESVIGSDRLRERVRTAKTKAAVEAAQAGGSDLHGELLEAVRRGDPAAVAIVDDLGSKVSLAAANLAVVMDPELILLAGELFDLVVGRIREVVERVIPWPVRIERSALGEDAVLMGAIGSARSLAHDLVCGKNRDESQLQERQVRKAHDI